MVPIIATLFILLNSYVVFYPFCYSKLEMSNECASSTNAKKWETELQTLRNNNARLSAALQESATNVDQWKKQLQTYQDENARLHSQVPSASSHWGYNSLASL